MSPIRGHSVLSELGEWEENFRDEPTGYKQGAGAENSIPSPQDFLLIHHVPYLCCHPSTGLVFKVG